MSVFDFFRLAWVKKLPRGVFFNLIEQLIKSATNWCQWKKNWKTRIEYLIWFKMSANKGLR